MPAMALFPERCVRLTSKIRSKEATSTQIIDLFVTHKVLGFPIFILFMWIMFEATFRLGGYPMEWIEALVEVIGNFVRGHMSEGPLKDLLVDGIIGGVGGVIVFLPNILILYMFISFMEDSGYMARAAFIMDKIMHKMGLHGKSFIPLVMGFGCNVPAIMASRTIESRNSRMITMLVNPLMSCSARLTGLCIVDPGFFPKNASFVLLVLYVSGILLAVIMARLFKRFLFNEEDVPFVMELPPYRDAYRQIHHDPYVGESETILTQNGRYYLSRFYHHLVPWVFPQTFGERRSV